MLQRLLCLLVGYLCGGFLTAELVARARTGKSAAALGTGNPGMANLAHELGKGWGAVVLAGDIAKTALAFGLCRALFPALGGLSGLWAGLGAVLGHNFPLWRGFRGGKGVAVTCAALILFSPLWGTAACLAGLAVTLLSGWLPLGAVVIPALFVPPAFLCCGREAGLLALILALVMLSRTSGGWAASSGGRRNENSVAAEPQPENIAHSTIPPALCGIMVEQHRTRGIPPCTMN